MKRVLRGQLRLHLKGQASAFPKHLGHLPTPIWLDYPIQDRFLEEGRYCRFVKNRTESTGTEREIGNVGIVGMSTEGSDTPSPKGRAHRPNFWGALDMPSNHICMVIKLYGD